MWICIVLYKYQVLVKFIIPLQSTHLAEVVASVQLNIFLYGGKTLNQLKKDKIGQCRKKKNVNLMVLKFFFISLKSSYTFKVKRFILYLYKPKMRDIFLFILALI